MKKYAPRQNFTSKVLLENYMLNDWFYQAGHVSIFKVLSMNFIFLYQKYE